MEKEFIPYEQALALKEMGFDKPCLGYYVGLGDSKEDPFKLVQIQSEKGQFEWTDNVYHAPLYQQAFRWFREKYEIHSSVFWVEMEGFIYWNYRYSYLNGRQVESVNRSITFFDTPEEAELECLKKLIEIIKQK
jgi:hypothetical protein